MLKRSADFGATSAIIKRSVVIDGHKTSVSLEDAFWKRIRLIARERDVPLSDLVGSIDSERKARHEPLLRHPPFRSLRSRIQDPRGPRPMPRFPGPRRSRRGFSPPRGAAAGWGFAMTDWPE